jgi:hypothetical protein
VLDWAILPSKGSAVDPIGFMMQFRWFYLSWEPL